MKDQPRKYRDRYDVTGNIEAEYVDADQTVLVNKLGITDLHPLQVQEEGCYIQAYETLLDEIRTNTPLTVELIRYVHQCIFGKLYQWAGRWRTVNISKPGITWPPPAFLDENMRLFEAQFLRKYPAEVLGDDSVFCESVAQIQGEFLVIHPFREGNARAIKLVTDLLSMQTGRSALRYDETESGREQYILAASQAFRRNYQPMIEIIRKAISTPPQGSITRP